MGDDIAPKESPAPDVTPAAPAVVSGAPPVQKDIGKKEKKEKKDKDKKDKNAKIELPVAPPPSVAPPAQVAPAAPPVPVAPEVAAAPAASPAVVQKKEKKDKK